MAYRSIFLAPDWQHVRYLGWMDNWLDPNLRVLRKRHGPLTRVLAISAVEDEARFEYLWRELHSKLGLTSELVLHDLTGNAAIAELMTSVGYSELGSTERQLNIATFAISLDRDEDALLAACSADTRRKLRKAESQGLAFDDQAHREHAQIEQFLTGFNAMARERALDPISSEVVRAMIAGGHARLFAVTEASAVDDPTARRSFLLSYETAATGFFLYGASDRAKLNDGAGQLLQWGAIRAFRAAGHSWYDMGGLPACDGSDGIFRFKKGFGGEMVDLGVEYGRSGALVRAARSARALVKRLKGGRHETADLRPD